jgi:hypothetical protein
MPGSIALLSGLLRLPSSQPLQEPCWLLCVIVLRVPTEAAAQKVHTSAPDELSKAWQSGLQLAPGSVLGGVALEDSVDEHNHGCLGSDGAVTWTRCAVHRSS